MTLAIARREVGAAFGTPTAWVFLAAFVALSAGLGLTGFFERGVADLRDHAFELRRAFLLLAPALAMRAWAEERHTGTIELLFTLPVRPVEAVLGKFLAGLAVLGLAVLLGLTLPLTLLPTADLDLGQVAAGALGALLTGALYLAVGLLMSALSRSQVVAFVLAALACGLLVVLGEPAVLREVERLLPTALVEGVADLGVSRHLEPLTRGLLDTWDVAYFVGLVALLLGWNTLAVERREGRPVEPLSVVVLSIVALALALGVAAARPVRARVDLTARRTNTLAGETRALLARLDAPLTVHAYVPDELPAGYEQVRPTLRHLVDALHALREAAPPGRVRLDVQDPLSRRKDALERQTLAARAEAEGVTPVTLHMQREDRAEALRIYCGVVLLHAGRAPVVVPTAVDRTTLDHDLAAAIRRVVLPRLRVGVSGPGADDYGHARAALARSYAVEAVDLSRGGPVPDGLALLVHTAPLPPTGPELVALDRYLERGGRVVLLVETHGIDGPSWRAEPFASPVLRAALARWGVALGPGVVLGPARRELDLGVVDGTHVRGPFPWFFDVTGPDDPESPVLAPGGARVLFPLAAPLGPGAPLPEVTFTPLLRGPPSRIVDGSIDIHPLRLPDPRGAPAPPLLACAVTGRLPRATVERAGPGTSTDESGPGGRPAGGAGGAVLDAPPARLVVVGDSDFCRDRNVGEAPGGVGLLLDLVDWALDRPVLASVRGRQGAVPLGEPAFLGASGDQAQALVWAVNLLLVPFAVLGAGLGGLAVAHRRRTRRAAAVRDAAGGGAT